MSYARAVDESYSAFPSIPCVVIDVRVLKTVSLGNVLSIDHIRVLIESCEWTESIGEGTSVTCRLSIDLSGFDASKGVGVMETIVPQR